MSEVMTKEEILEYQLMEFSNTDPEDLDTTFEVCYETASGGEAWVDVCAIDLAERTLKYIEELKKSIPISKIEEFISEHENKWNQDNQYVMDSLQKLIDEAKNES